MLWFKMARITDWILDGLARWRAEDLSVAVARYVPSPYAHLLDEQLLAPLQLHLIFVHKNDQSA